MTTHIRPLNPAWAAGHRTLLLLLALVTVLVATVAVAATVAMRQPALAPAPRPAAPATSVQNHCPGSALVIVALPIC